MGGSPGLKRAMNRDTIEIALTGQRPLTHDELTSAFYTTVARSERE